MSSRGLKSLCPRRKDDNFATESHELFWDLNAVVKNPAIASLVL